MIKLFQCSSSSRLIIYKTLLYVELHNVRGAQFVKLIERLDPILFIVKSRINGRSWPLCHFWKGLNSGNGFETGSSDRAASAND